MNWRPSRPIFVTVVSGGGGSRWTSRVVEPRRPFLSSDDQFVIYVQPSRVLDGQVVDGVEPVRPVAATRLIMPHSSIDLRCLEQRLGVRWDQGLTGRRRQLNEEEQLVDDWQLSSADVTLCIGVEIVEYRLDGVAIGVT